MWLQVKATQVEDHQAATLCAAQLILIAPFQTAAASFTGQRNSQVAANMEYSVTQKAVFSSQSSCKQNITILNGWSTY